MPRHTSKIIITLDLRTARTQPNYYLLNKLMRNLGFRKFSPNRGLDFPHNTYYGEFQENINMNRLKINIWELLVGHHISIRRIFCGKLVGWSMRARR